MKKSNFITILIFALFIAGSIFVMNKDYNKEAVHKVVKENSVAKVKKPVSKPQKKKEEKKQDKVEEDKKQVSRFFYAKYTVYWRFQNSRVNGIWKNERTRLFSAV